MKLPLKHYGVGHLALQNIPWTQGLLPELVDTTGETCVNGCAAAAWHDRITGIRVLHITRVLDDTVSRFAAEAFTRGDNLECIAWCKRAAQPHPREQI